MHARATSFGTNNYKRGKYNAPVDKIILTYPCAGPKSWPPSYTRLKSAILGRGLPLRFPLYKNDPGSPRGDPRLQALRYKEWLKL